MSYDFVYLNFDAAKAKEQIKERIKLAELSTIFVDWILDYAETHKGKQLNKRIHTAMLEAFPKYTISWDDNRKTYGQVYINIWGNGISMDQKLHIFIGYDSDETFEPERVKERLMAWYLDRDRIEKYRESLKNVNRWVRAMQKAQKIIEDTRAEARQYEVEYYIEARK